MDHKKLSRFLVVLTGLFIGTLLSCEQDSPKRPTTAPSPQPPAGQQAGTETPDDPEEQTPGKGGSTGQVSGNPAEVLHADATTEFGLHLSYINHRPTGNYVYNCPGDSFINGLSSTYDTTALDRRQRYYCQFFKDGTGRPLRKGACSYHNENEAPGKPREATCPTGRFLAGVKSNYSADLKDRSESYLCCEMRNPEGKKAVVDANKCSTNIPAQLRPIKDPKSGASFGPVVNDEINAIQDALDYQCANGAKMNEDFTLAPIKNAGLTSIRSRFVGPKSDRYFSMTCCGLKME